MAAKASADKVAADMRPPDYRFAVQTVRGTLPTEKAHIARINGKIGDMFARIEGKGVNKKGAKIFAALDVLEPEERNDILRTLEGMVAASGWELDAHDLADEAEGRDNVVHALFGGAKQDGEGAEGDEVIDNVVAEIEKPKRGRKPKGAAPEVAVDERSQQNAKAAEAARVAKERIEAAANGGAKPEPYTGDNSDLAGE